MRDAIPRRAGVQRIVSLDLSQSRRRSINVECPTRFPPIIFIGTKTRGGARDHEITKASDHGRCRKGMEEDRLGVLARTLYAARDRTI